MNVDEGVIIACASGIQTSVALAVIRLSGFSDIENLSSFFSINLRRLKPYQMLRTNLLDGNKILDDICLCFFKAPRS